MLLPSTLPSGGLRIGLLGRSSTTRKLRIGPSQLLEGFRNIRVIQEIGQNAQLVDPYTDLLRPRPVSLPHRSLERLAATA
jgi:hypothetical protein